MSFARLRSRRDPTLLWIAAAIGTIALLTGLQCIRFRTARAETLPHHVAARGLIQLGR